MPAPSSLLGAPLSLCLVLAGALALPMGLRAVNRLLPDEGVKPSYLLIKNFEQPYLATGPGDFWRRWNISLSTWFRDYLYIPLGGSRRGPWRQAANILITFLASGLWHGASWNYVLWGAYHGTLLVMARARGPASPKQDPKRGWLRPLQIAGMFVLSCIGWLIFRETEFAQLVRDLPLVPWQSSAIDRSAGIYLFLLAALYSVPLWIQDLWVELKGVDLAAAIDSPEIAVNWRRTAAQTLLCGVLMTAIVTLRSQTSLDFIYFAF